MKYILKIVILFFIISSYQLFSQNELSIDIQKDKIINEFSNFIDKPIGELLDTLIKQSIFYDNSKPIMIGLNEIIGYSFTYQFGLSINIYVKDFQHIESVIGVPDEFYKIYWPLKEIRRELISQIELRQNNAQSKRENYFIWRIIPEKDVIKKK